MDFGWIAPFGASIVGLALVMLWVIGRKAEKAVEELQSIKHLLLVALYDDERRYSQVRRIAEAVEHANRPR
ncbi:MAG: hypothetical protein NT015_00950 [Alphaproteobacteria bacterium]|nr:hypothetical protein [Alphaproteobacteria bacterium]